MSEPTTVAAATDLEEVFEIQAQLCHKINNPLTSIMGRAQILQMKHGSDEKLSKEIAVIEESSKRVAALIREMAHVVCDAKARFKNPSED